MLGTLYSLASCEEVIRTSIKQGNDVTISVRGTDRRWEFSPSGSAGVDDLEEALAYLRTEVKAFDVNFVLHEANGRLLMTLVFKPLRKEGEKGGRTNARNAGSRSDRSEDPSAENTERILG